MASRVRKRLPLGTTAPARARGSLEPLRGQMDPESFESLRLLVSELVNNSVKHSGRPEGDPIVLDVEVEEDAVRAEVIDRGSGFTRAPPPAVVGTAASGWGLRLVDRLADDWGYSARDATHVWFEMSTRPKVGAGRSTS